MIDRGNEFAEGRRAAEGEIARDDEGDLRFHLGLHQASDRQRRAVEKLHVVEQHAEIRLVDAELALHRSRSETDLLAGDARPRGEPRCSIDGGDGIGLVHRGNRKMRRDRRTLPATAARLAQRPRSGVENLVGCHYSVSSEWRVFVAEQRHHAVAQLGELVAQRVILGLVAPEADALMDDLRPGFTLPRRRWSSSRARNRSRRASPRRRKRRGRWYAGRPPSRS